VVVLEVPLTGDAERFSITMGGVNYQLTLVYRDAAEGGWVLDVADANGTAIVGGIPLVTGCDLLEQYSHLGFTGSLVVQTDHDPDAPPTYANLGGASHLYFVAQS
jgi:hypothetical protein